MNFTLRYVAREGSHHSGNWGGVLRNPATVSWLSAPTKANSGCALDARDKTPSSSTHAVHQEAQKFSTTGLPCSCHTRTCSPYWVSIASLGAVLPSTEGLARAACWRPQASDTTSTVARPMATAAKTPDLRLTRLSLVIQEGVRLGDARV